MSYSNREVAESIIQNSFGIHQLAWENDNFDIEPIEYNFFTEIYEISLSEEDLRKHPEAKNFLELFPFDFIKLKVGEAKKSNNYSDFVLCRMKYFSLINQHPEENQTHLRRGAIYRMHCALMKRDFGARFDSLSSDCRGLTKEAEDFISSRGQ